MSIESEGDLRGLQHVGRIVALILAEMQSAAVPGITTAALDVIGGDAMKRHGVRSAPQVTYRFPGFTCISINEEIVHGVPGPRRLSTGDIVKIDVTAEAGGYVADAARTVIIGGGSALASRLRHSAVAALRAALRAARAGNPVSAIGRAVERQAIAVEPMLTAVPAGAVQMPDGWTIRTSNGALAAHEEHTIVIRRDRPLVLTAA